MLYLRLQRFYVQGIASLICSLLFAGLMMNIVFAHFLVRVTSPEVISTIATESDQSVILASAQDLSGASFISSPSFYLSLSIGLVLLFFSILWLKYAAKAKPQRLTRWVAWVMAGTFLCAQLSLVIFQLSRIQSAAENELQLHAAMLTEATQASLKRLNKSGERATLNAQLQQLLNENQQIISLSISDATGQVNHALSSPYKSDSELGALVVLKHLSAGLKDLTVTQSLQQGGRFSLELSAWPVRQQMAYALIDSGTVALITFLLSVELTLLLMSLSVRQSSSVSQKNPAGCALIRPAIFLFLFGIDISMSFMPLHMERLNDLDIGLSPDVVMSLPISAEFFCVGVALIYSGVWLDKQGWQRPFIAGLLISFAGGLYSWLAPDALQLIAARAVVGFGYGLTILAAQGCVICHTNPKNKAHGLAHLFAGLYSGSICGAATGAILAAFFDYEFVFLVGLGIAALVVIYTVVFILETLDNSSPAKVRPAKLPKATVSEHRENYGSENLLKFLTDRRVLATIFFSSLPASVAAIGFIYYFSPVYLSRLGVSESTVGQVLMLFGIILTLFSPAFGRMVDNAESKETPILIGGLLGGCAFIAFSTLQGIAATSVAVILLGLSNCLVWASQSAYVLSLDVTQSLGEGKALGIFLATSRVGQMLGPVVFAWLMLVSDIEAGVTWFGVIYLVMAALFLVMTASFSPLMLRREN